MTDAKNVDNGGMGRRVSEVGDLLNDMTIIDPRATVDFVGKLATENGWTPERAGTVYAEYLRFLLMAWMSPTMVVPSRDVDQAWHLHLTCTRHYWDVMCGEILRKPLHHDPAMGDDADAARHEDHYGRTLALYAYLFDEEAPADVWPRGCSCKAHRPGSRAGEDVVLASSGWAMMAALTLVGAGVSFFIGFMLTGAFLVVLTVVSIVAAAASAADREMRRSVAETRAGRSYAATTAPASRTSPSGRYAEATYPNLSKSGSRTSSSSSSSRSRTQDSSGSDAALAFIATGDDAPSHGSSHSHSHSHSSHSTHSGHSDANTHSCSSSSATSTHSCGGGHSCGGSSCGSSCGGGGD